MATITKKYGESVTLTATPNSGYEFSSWSGDASGSTNPLTITVTGDMSVTGNFSVSEKTITYFCTEGELTGTWVDNNTDTSKNTYDSTTYEGVFYLIPGATLGGGQDTSYSPFCYTYSKHISIVDLRNSGLTTIGNYAFYQCNNLVQVNLPSSATSIGKYCFYGCDIMTVCDLASIVTIGDYAFEDCVNLTRITIPNTVTTINTGAFMNCSNLSTITIPSSVTTLGGSIFSGCTNLTSANIQASIVTLPEAIFSNCSSLSTVSLPNTLTSFDAYVFRGCTSLETISLPSNLAHIGNYAFNRCSNLGSVSIPYSVTDIGYWAFQSCSHLLSVTLGESNKVSQLTTINNGAFSGCNNLLSVTCEATTPPTLGTNNFTASNDTLYVPSASVSAYQNDANWSAAFSDIQAIQ